MKTTLAALLIGAALFAGCNTSRKFSDADVSGIEADIKANYEKNGFTVEQVSMVRDSDRHMSGFIKMRKPGLLTGKIELHKNCTATMDEGSGKSIWECK